MSNKKIFNSAIAILLALILGFTMMPANADAASKKPAKVSGVKITKVTKSTVTLSWKKTSRTNGYRVYKKASGSKKWSKAVTTKNRKATVKKLKSGKKYSFKVRAYTKKNGKKVWGKYSAVKTVVTKSKAENYRVVFNTNGGSTVDTQSIAKGTRVTKPISPSKEGCVFEGWYTDPELTKEFDFGIRVYKSLTLYAKWREDTSISDDGVVDLADIQILSQKGKIEVIYGSGGQVLSADGKFTKDKVNDIDDAANVLESAQTLFGEEFYVDADNLDAQKLSIDSDEETVYRYTPTIYGIPVLGSQVILTADDDGNATGLFNNYDSRIENVDVEAEIDEVDATKTVKEHIVKNKEVKTYLQKLADGDVRKDYSDYESDFLNYLELETKEMIYAVEDEEEPVYVFAVSVNFNEEYAGMNDGIFDRIAFSPNIYYVHANGDNAGKIYKEESNISCWTDTSVQTEDSVGLTRTINVQKEGSEYRLNDTARNIATQITEKDANTGETLEKGVFELFSSSNWNKKAISLHANMGRVYDYYKKKLGRKSYNARGARIIQWYDAAKIQIPKNNGEGYKDMGENAAWCGGEDRFFIYGNGNYESCLDVVAHEFTHAVGEYMVTLNGKPYGLSGSQGDALNEAFSDIMGCLIENKSGEARWKLGEDSDGGGLRSLSTPAHFRDFSINKDDHENCKIFDHAAYLMMTDNRTSAITSSKWARVFYRAYHKLGVSARFINARAAVIAASKQEGYNSSQQEAIREAFDKVGITEPDCIRIVLNWGEYPEDLDSHLVGPDLYGGQFHTYYEDMHYYGPFPDGSRKYAADLNYDDTTSFGPEITTITTFTPGNYYFYVHDYTNRESSNSIAMAKSKARISIYRGSHIIPLYTRIINASTEGLYWLACKINIDNRLNVTYSFPDTYSYNVPSTHK